MKNRMGPPVVLAAALATTPLVAGAAPTFTCRPLLDEATSPQTLQSSAHRINNRNQILGLGFGAWQGGPSLGPMQWGRDRVGHRILDADTSPVDMNDAGEVVGWVTDTAGVAHPTKWVDGQQIDLGTLPAAHGRGHATAINSHGVAVGVSQIVDQGLNWATLWRNGKIRRLPGLSSKDNTFAWDINDDGVVLGYSGHPSADTPVIWKDGLPVALHNPPGAIGSYVKAINNAGVSIGTTSYQDLGSRATAWRGVEPIDLGSLSNYNVTEPSQINDAGAIVGVAHSNLPTMPTAVYWASLDDAPMDLNDLVVGGCTDVFGVQHRLNTAWSINDKGVIVANATDEYWRDKVAFRLTPR